MSKVENDISSTSENGEALAKCKLTDVKDLTKGNPYKLILQFSFPIFLSQLFQQLYNTADTFIVGKFLGTESLAAVSSSGTLIFLLISFFVGTSMGAGVVISKYFGAGDEDKVSRSIHTNVVFGLVAGAIITVIGVAFTPTFLKWMKTDADILPEAVEYFRYYFLGIMTVVMYNVFRGIMTALGDSKRPLIYLIISSVLNVFLDLLFVGLFHWGVWSAAVATVISQLVSVVLCLIHLTKKGKIYTISFKKLKISKDMLIEIIKYGMPAGVQNSVIGFANVIVQTQINSFGKFATAGFGTYSKIEGFAFLPINSFTMAITTFVGQNLGAGLVKRTKRGATFGILVGVISTELIGVIVYFLAPELIGLFDSTPEVIAYGVKQARIVSLFYCILAYSHSVAAVCRGAGKAFVPMAVMLAIWCVFRITYILLVMKFIGKIEYVYRAYPITWGLSSIIFLIYYYCSKWCRPTIKNLQTTEKK